MESSRFNPRWLLRQTLPATYWHSSILQLFYKILIHLQFWNLSILTILIYTTIFGTVYNVQCMLTLFCMIITVYYFRTYMSRQSHLCNQTPLLNLYISNEHWCINHHNYVYILLFSILSLLMHFNLVCFKQFSCTIARGATFVLSEVMIYTRLAPLSLNIALLE